MVIPCPPPAWKSSEISFKSRVQPALGRVFTAEEARSGAGYPIRQARRSPACQRLLEAPVPFRSRIVGQAIELNGAPVTVVGCCPRVSITARCLLLARKPIFRAGEPRNRAHVGQHCYADRPPQTGRHDCAGPDDANRVTPNMYFNTKYPQSKGRYKGQLVPVPLKDYVTGKLHRSLIALWFAVGTILLIAGVNLSNLLLARSAARAKEFAMRGALAQAADASLPTSDGEPRALGRRCGHRSGAGARPHPLARAPGIAGSSAAQLRCGSTVRRCGGRFLSPSLPQ